MIVYATVEEMEQLWRAMSLSEKSRAKYLLEAVSASLREEARKVGKDLDAMIKADEDLGLVARSVTVDIVARALMTSTDQEPMTQMSESGNGYSASGTFLVPGGGLFIKKTELERLGLRRQKYGVMEPYDYAQGNDGQTV